MNKNYLHIHSTYSVGDSAQSPEDIVLQVKKLGGENVTLTDHRTLLGIDAFMDAGRKHDINTIPGVENEVNLPEKYAIILSNGDDERKEALSHVRAVRRDLFHQLLDPRSRGRGQGLVLLFRDPVQPDLLGLGGDTRGALWLLHTL